MKKTSLLLLASLLSACTVGHEEFNCPNDSKGYGCKGLKEVHALVNQDKKEEAPILSPIAPHKVDLRKVASSDQAMIQRAQEEHLRIWIAPFQDDQGNFHEPSVIHTVIRPSYWQMNTINWE
ncbi:TraV family lipoprotein [Candidatus Odyssella thessalonicensis]|uniref:TraV family lipoprotein n=1 Tax=Candidatus Odyssella thessalonicensis TaxID=84647 RepID=UPI000225ACE0|nr:TraV family lipoprotein [Candidatus Odyssella thessalonicensis]